MKTLVKRKLMGWTFVAFLGFSFLQVQGQTVGEAGPDFEVDLLGGGTYKLSDMSGKVVLVFFFGNTCPACVTAGPHLESDIYQEFMSNENFTAIGLDVWDSSSSSESVGAFKDQTGVSFPLGLKAAKVASDYGSTRDRLLVIDQEGVLVHKGGSGAKNDIPNAVEAIQEALMVAGLGQARTGQNVAIYPVPARDQVNFEARDEIRTIRLYNAGGMLIREQNYASGTNQVMGLEGIVGGLYFYRVDLASGSSTGKIIVR